MWRALEERRIRSHYLPHFVECERARTPLPFGSPPEILFAARAGREDARVLFAAMRIVRRAVDGVTLCVVGGEGGLREEAAREGVSSSVLFAEGPVDAALEEGLLRSSVVVFPATVKENCPPLLLEAMAHERPVVAGRSGGIPELVEDGENGFLVRPGDPEGLAKALLGVLLDGDRAREMGERGRRRVMARFSGERHLREILKIYRELLWDADRG
jgi:glycosyltransferase involved in cell wall biosynthesis